MSSTNRSEPWRDTERAALKVLSAQLEAVCERVHADEDASLDDFADQLEVIAEWLPWQSDPLWRSSVEKMIPHAREGGQNLDYWVRVWRIIEPMVTTWRIVEEIRAPRPAPTAADPLDHMEWREVDGEMRLVERERTRAERRSQWMVDRDRQRAIVQGPGGIGTVDLPDGVFNALWRADVLRVAELQRRIADGSIADVKDLGPSRCTALVHWGREHNHREDES